MQLIHSAQFYLGYFMGGLCMEQTLGIYIEDLYAPLFLLNWLKPALCEAIQGHGLTFRKAIGNPVIFLMYLAEKEAGSRYAKYLEGMTRYFSEQARQQEEIRRFRHDIKNHYISLSNLLKLGNMEVARQYVEQLYSSVDQRAAFIQTGNPAMDMLLCEKIWEAQEKGITVESHIRITRQIAVTEFDWSVLLGNALDNAIEANCNLEASRRKIHIQICSQANVVHILIRNPVSSGTRKSTDKKDVQNHGFGLRNMQAIVDKYHGVMQYKGENGVFTLTVLLCDV